MMKMSVSSRYLAYGIAFGIMFPVIANIIIVYQDYNAFSLQSMIAAQISSPLLWIIDTAPFFLGLFAWKAGLNQEKVNYININLEKKIKKQTHGIKRINERLREEIREREEKEMLLVQAMEDAYQGIKSKDQFLSNMSHEIRTPMNGIIGMTDLLLSTELNELQRQYLSAIDYSSKNLLVIINDILDLSKINSEKLELEVIHFSIRDILSAMQKTFEVKVNEKAIRLNVDIEDAVPDKLCGDPVRINQILLNVVGNAIKFTDQGSVNVRCGLLQESKEGLMLTFDVIDTGIGIRKENVNTIFESFSQANNSVTRKYGGTGLGLPISKKLIELHGGALIVKSEYGEGTTFSFTLDTKHAIVEETIVVKKVFSVSASQKSAIRILLAEDNKINQLVATKFLDRFGFQADIANNGQEAVQKTEEQAYDLILMDVQMPELDGLQATRIIKSSAKTVNKSIKIMAMTASVLKNEIDRCYDAGMDDYIPKPFNPDELYEKIVHLTMNVKND